MENEVSATASAEQQQGGSAPAPAPAPAPTASQETIQPPANDAAAAAEVAAEELAVGILVEGEEEEEEEEEEMLDLDSKELEWLSSNAKGMQAEDPSGGATNDDDEQEEATRDDETNGDESGGVSEEEEEGGEEEEKREELLPSNKRDWLYSEEREEGARVYAEFSNGEYYWGHIVDVRNSKRTGRKYKVLFEDGDSLGNLTDKQVYTEVQYTKIFEIDPPEPAIADQAMLDKLKSESTDIKKQEKKKRKRSQPPQGASRSTKGSAEADPVIDTAFLDTGEGDQAAKMSPRDLYMERCKSCALCTRPDCGLCSTCLRNRNRKKKSLKEVCLRKMCCGVEPRLKAQPAVGFSPGWRFFFEEKRKGSMSTGFDASQSRSCPGLHIVSSEGQKYSSIEGAALRDVSASIDVEAMCQQFRAHIGIAYYHVDPHHFLVNKGYCHEWTDVQGRNNIVFGVISRCSREEGDVKFTVVYSDESLSFLDSVSSSFKGAIQRTQKIPSELAWGGCIAFERINRIRRGPGSVIKKIDRTMACKTWITPTVRREELVEYNGVMVPQLTVIVRGFMLVFSVKTSTIPNAGYGVFVKCTSLRSCASSDDTESFQFRAGEVLDLGVYAPFRAEDKKHMNVFNLKAYVFSMECEEWCFNSLDEDYMYDITDDKSGKVHDLARKNIPMYVNECSAEAVPTIHARLDPADNVHYLLGIVYHGDWDDYKEDMKQLALKVDGDEQEVFINYGSDYEAVRIRKGYSTLPEESQREVLEGFAEHENGFVRDIDHYDAKEVAMSVDFFLKRCILPEDYSKDKPIKGEVRDRALEVSRKLRARAQRLLDRVHESVRQQAQQRESSEAVSSTDQEVDDHDLEQTIKYADVLIERLMTISCDRELKSLEKLTPDVPDTSNDDMDISSPDDDENVDGEDYGSDSSFDG